MASCVSPTSISYLAILIELHHKSYHTCYPVETITPKIHYVVHFPELIRRYVHYTVILYVYLKTDLAHQYSIGACEWKPRIHTQRAASGGNFKNICLFMAVRHQRLLCSQLINPSMLM